MVPNTPEDKRGFANRVFAGLAPILARSKELKARNRPKYLALKWSVNFLLLLILLLPLAGIVNLVMNWLD